MYEPERPNTGMHFFIILGITSIIGWFFFYFYKPTLIEASCSDIAYNSYKLNSRKQTILNADSNYDTLKARCLEGAYSLEASK